MAEKRILKENGVDILPITHESAVLTEEGTTLNEKYATKEEVNSEISDINNRISIIDSKVGELSSLQTTDKSSITNAINELFLFGNSVKQKLVDTLIAKGVEASTNETFETLVNKFNDIEFSSPLPYAAEHDAYGKIADLPAARYLASAEVVGDKIYFMGGCNSTSAFTYNYCYDIKANTWESKTNMPARRAGHCSCIIGSDIHVMGGTTTSEPTKVNVAHYCYDSLTDTWSQKTDLPIALNRASSESIGGYIYVFGGWNGSSTLKNTTYRYDPSSKSWTTMANMTAARANAASFVRGNNIHVLGGHNSNEYSQSTHYYYDTIANTWTTSTALPQSRDRFRALSLNDRIYIFSGYVYSSSTTASRQTAYYYDFTSSSWTKITNVKDTTSEYLYWYSAVAHDNKAYILGGYDSNASTSDCWVFAP